MIQVNKNYISVDLENIDADKKKIEARRLQVEQQLESEENIKKQMEAEQAEEIRRRLEQRFLLDKYRIEIEIEAEKLRSSIHNVSP